MTGRLLKKIFQKKKDSLFKKEVPRNDVDLPLGLRHGALVRIDPSLAILTRDQSQVKLPSEELYVQGHSKMDIAGVDGFRFYLQQKDKPASETDKTSIIQYFSSGSTSDLIYFQLLDEIYPSDDEEWEEWLGDDGHIGSQFFTITEDDGQEFEYTRCWDDSDRWVRPEIVVEDLYPAPYNDDKVIIEHQMMLYNRPLPEDLTEYLLLSASQTEDEASVSLLHGIKIPNTTDLRIV